MTATQRAQKLYLCFVEAKASREEIEDAIAAAIRDAVAEAEATKKQAIQERDDANHQRNMAESKAERNWDMYLNAERRYTTCREESQGWQQANNDLLEERAVLWGLRDGALTALEPFARLAERFSEQQYCGSLESCTVAASFTLAQLRAARDAYLALGGKLE